MTDMRTKSLHMIFDMADKEYTVYVASPYNIFVEPRRSQVHTALSFYGLGELVEHEYRPTSENVQEWFPHLQVAPVYILKASMDRLPPGGVGQLHGEVAQQTGFRNVVLKVWTDDVTEETEKKSNDALLSHQPGDHPDETQYTPEQAAALHGPKRIAAIMAELGRSDEEKYGNYATTTFAASSSALKEMLNKPFRKGVYACRASGGEIIVEKQLTGSSEACDMPYFSTKKELEEHVSDNKHRSMLETMDYLAESDDELKKAVADACRGAGVEILDTGIMHNDGVVYIPLQGLTNSLRRLSTAIENIQQRGVHANDPSVYLMHGRQYLIFYSGK